MVKIEIKEVVVGHKITGYMYGQDLMNAHKAYLHRVGALPPKNSWRQTTPAPSGNKKKGG